MDSSKVASYLNIARKANGLIIGTENLTNHNKKLYLILITKNAGKSARNVAQTKQQKTGCKFIEIDLDLSNMLNINNCQVVALKNKGLADMVIENLK